MGHRETLLKRELRQVLRLDRDLGSHACAHSQAAAALLTKNSEAENILKEQGGPDTAWLMSREITAQSGEFLMNLLQESGRLLSPRQELKA